MKLHVIGHKGIVGGATYELLSRLGHEVTGSDKDQDIPYGIDTFFICTPEDNVGEVIRDLLSRERLHVVVRSTTPVGTIQELSAKYEVCISHWPEHLREATAVWDCYFPPFINIGECCKLHGDKLEDLLRPLGVPIIRSDTITSEASKYAINCFKATVISFWNEFYELSKSIGFNAHLASRIAANDPVVPTYGIILGKAYGGRCLPKDMRRLIDTAKDYKVSLPVLEAAEEVNRRIREVNGESEIKTG